MAFGSGPHGEPVNFQFAINLLNQMGSAACATARHPRQRQMGLRICILLVFTAGVSFSAECSPQVTPQLEVAANQQEIAKTRQATEQPDVRPNLESTEDWNRHLRERSASIVDPAPGFDPREYVIGPEDVLDINVFEAPEINRDVRVSASGEISLPLLGAVRAAGFTPRELETALEELLHQKYMKDPHVSVFVRDMQSHPVSVMGAVRKPGIFQIRGTKTLLEILSLAEGLADDAGEDVIILRRASQKNAPELSSAKASDLADSFPVVRLPGLGGPGTTDTGPDKVGANSQEVVQVNLKDLLDSTDPRHNPAVYPGDIVKVSRAGIVYAVGAVQRPGGFAMKTNEKISVLQVIALSEGLTRTAAKSGARIIRTSEQNGARTETPIDLGKILSGKSPDPMLGARDIVFVPDSATKATLSRGVEAAAQTLTGLLVFH
jgi:polysaccharide export outer membrane protein